MNLKHLSSLSLLLLLFLMSHISYAQYSTSLTSISLVKPTDCNLTYQYFDISHLQCQNCPANSGSRDYYNCRCNQNYYFTMNNGGGSIACAPCDTGLIQSLDGYTCVLCNETCQNCQSLGGHRADLDENGNYYRNSNNQTISICFICNGSSSIPTGDSCQSCKPEIFIGQSTIYNMTTATCNANGILATGGMLIIDESTASVPSAFNVVFGTDSSINSWYYSTYLVAIYKTCLYTAKRNVSACEALGNLCVLNLYNNLSPNNLDACKAFDSIPKSTSSNTGSNSNAIVWGDNMPWLTYYETYGSYASFYSSTGISDSNSQFIKLKFTNKCNPPDLAFYAAQYALNGTLLKFGPFDISNLQLCHLISTYPSVAQISPFSGTNFLQSCSISANSLLQFSSQPVFYDFYLKYSSASNVFPLPIEILNYKDPSTGSEINRDLSDGNHRMQRRFFLVDTISSKKSLTDTPKYIRYPKSIRFKFDLIKDQTDGKIYPPLIKIDYDFVSTDDLNKTVSISFQIAYEMNLDTQSIGIWVSVGVLCLISFLWAGARSWVWSRRSGKLGLDIITLFKFLMYLCAGFANSFFVVMVGLSIYWLIFYKGQGIAFVLIPMTDQQQSFVALLLIAGFFKLIDVIHLILTQSSFDVFFIDWERPRIDTIQNNDNQTTSPRAENDKFKEETKLLNDELKKYSRVSCWRTLFVANEWNEIQTFRKINPTIQLIGVLFFLKVINLEALTTEDCNTNIIRDPNLFQAPYSPILRVAMAASMFIGLAFFQYIVYNFLYIRCIQDTLGQFIDFCSVANISMFIITHTQYGYYIHGRSPHGNADTSMQEMAKALMKEEKDLSAKRGLEDGTDSQTFSISISDKLSKQYAKIMSQLYDRQIQKKTVEISNDNDFRERLIAYTKLNRFLIAFIDNILRDMRYMIVRRNILENLFNLEFRDPLLTGYFYKDEEPSFQNAIFCGVERKLLIFDLLVFLIVDFFAENYVLAAFITFIVIKAYEMLRNHLGRRNISRKTLVDKRFLI